MVDQEAQRLAGVEDVVEQQDVAAAHVGHEFGADAQGAGRGRRAAVAGRLDEADAQGQIDAADEVGQEHEAAGQDADDGGRPAAEVGGDLPGQLIDPRLDALGGKENFHVRFVPHPGGQPNDRPPSRCRCRCGTVWPARSLQLSTRR